MKNTLPVLLLLLMMACGENKDAQTTEEKSSATKTTTTETTVTVQSPFEGFDLEMQTFTIQNALKDQEIKLASGGKIFIPAGSVVDKSGNAVGDYEIKFREIQTPAEIIASGIPMVYDSAGVKMNFESAGMFEIRAYKNDEPLEIAPDKSIKVDITSNKSDKNFNFYKLDDKTQNWGYESTCSPRPNPGKKDIKAIEEEIKALEKPTQPVKYTPADKIFDLKLDFDEQLEFAELSSLMWKFQGTDPAQDPFKSPDFFKHQWNMIRMLPSKEIPGAYEISLAKEKDTVKFNTVAVPVYRGKTLDKANEKFTAMLAEYNEVLEERMAEKDRIQREGTFLRSMELQGFGIYNYDRQLKFEENIPVLASFEFDNYTLPEKTKATIFLVIKSTNSCVKYTPETFDKFAFDPNADNGLVAILPNDVMAVFTSDDFSKLDVRKIKNSGKYTFTLKVQDKKPKNVQDLNASIASL